MLLNSRLLCRKPRHNTSRPIGLVTVRPWVLKVLVPIRRPGTHHMLRILLARWLQRDTTRMRCRRRSTHISREG